MNLFTSARRLRAALLGFLLLASALPARALPKEGDDWFRLTSPNFTFFSNASERNTLRIAVSLERLRSVLLQLNPGMPSGSDRPTLVYIFRNEPALTPYKPLENGKRIDVDGFFVSAADANYMALHAEMDIDASALVYRGYLFHLLASSYPQMPLWLEEGMAGLYSTFKSTDQAAEIGHASPDQIRWLRESNLIPLAQLLAVDRDSPVYRDDFQGSVFRAESWAFVHYLLLGNEARRPQALQYFTEAARGNDSPELFRRAFNADEATLEKELRDYIRRSLFNYVRVPVEPEAKIQTKVEPLPRYETLTRLGDLLALQGPEQSAAAAEHFRAALATKPDYGSALAGLSRIEEAAGRTEEARSLRDKALQLAPDDYNLQLRQGLDLLAQGGDAATLEKARAAFARAAQLRPDSSEAWVRLADTYNHESSLPPQAVTAYENVHRLMPSAFAGAYNLMFAYSRTGQREKAAELIEKDIVPFATPDQVRAAWGGWIGEGRQEAENLIHEKKLEEAIPVLEAVQRRAPAEHTQPVAARLTELRHVVAVNRFAARYNEAVALLQQKKLDEAYAILTNLAAAAPDPESAEAARKLTEQVAAMRKAQKPAKKK
jgi:hypothetical protein